MPPDLELTNLLKPLDAHFWPKTRDCLVLHGENIMHNFAKQLGEPTQDAVEEFHTWKSCMVKTAEKVYKFKIASKIYLATSAECERGFSVINDTDKVSQMTSSTDLGFAPLHGC